MRKFITDMKCQAVQLFVFLLLETSFGTLRQKRESNILDVTRIEQKGVSCQSNRQRFCHGNIVKQYGRNYANVCNDGTVKLMRIYPGYTGPSPCMHGGKKFCSGDKVAGGGSVFVEQICEDGTVFFINKVTGLKFQKGRLSGQSETKMKDMRKKNTVKFNQKIPKSTTTTAPKSTKLSTIAPTEKSPVFTTRKFTTPSRLTTTRKPTTTTKRSTTIPDASLSKDVMDIVSAMELENASVQDNLKPEIASKATDIISNALDEMDRTTTSSNEKTTVLPMSMVSAEYVNTILEENMSDAKVLQCWTQYSICFIQIGPDLPRINVGQNSP